MATPEARRAMPARHLLPVPIAFLLMMSACSPDSTEDQQSNISTNSELITGGEGEDDLIGGEGGDTLLVK